MLGHHTPSSLPTAQPEQAELKSPSGQFSPCPTGPHHEGFANHRSPGNHGHTGCCQSTPCGMWCANTQGEAAEHGWGQGAAADCQPRWGPRWLVDCPVEGGHQLSKSSCPPRVTERQGASQWLQARCETVSPTLRDLCRSWKSYPLHLKRLPVKLRAVCCPCFLSEAVRGGGTLESIQLNLILQMEN